MAISSYFSANGRGTVGRLKDGSAIGVIRESNTGADTAFGWNIRVRYYKGLLILEILQYTANTTTIPGQENWSVRGREILENRPLSIAFNPTTINNFASRAELQAIGLDNGMFIPSQINSSLEIPYELDADFQINKKSLPVTDADFLAAAQAANQINLAAVAGSGSTPASTTSTTLFGMEFETKKFWQIFIVISLLVTIYLVGKKMKWFK